MTTFQISLAKPWKCQRISVSLSIQLKKNLVGKVMAMPVKIINSKNLFGWWECSFWVHKKCSDIPGRLVEDPDVRYRKRLGNERVIDGRPCVEVQLADRKLDVVDNFVYLGDCICPGEGCELAIIKRCHSAWGKFTEPLLTFKAISLSTRGQMYNSCVTGTMLYSSEC